MRSNEDHTEGTIGCETAVEAINVRKTYGSGAAKTAAVAGITARFAKGQFTAIVGPSGSGKTTLLHLLAGLDTPTSGRVIIDGVDISTLSDDAISDLRRDRIGFIFQDFNLLPYLTAEQNIELPFTLRGRQPDRQTIRGIARELDIENRLDHKPQEMSGGQRQRVAVARALAGNPAVVFADEPTGALDVKSSRQLLAILRDMASRRGQTIVMVTHDPNAAAYADRALVVRDGLIAADIEHPTAADVTSTLEHDADSPLPLAGGVAAGDGGWSNIASRKEGTR
ncbi:ATP-binding cassette domain-containing protein [Bifidobacterium sp. SMB2]|uniref:ATP-binding cassette domain-containing protein n=1 Tax=Bifidobacterium saimiriisciurei TaxID=2661627 RepID=A0ABX0CBF0_9BIFI|nr:MULTISPECIES: ABC transporter ATP-binding protein [Bifidobacterium]NEG96916.1 ATP-binding cassette domain-containing protein [Bifidobacterium sp. SMB2]NEH11554.1 ATP-binding cassette domain-containing protein [Bifidobacterium saimiriisciurei]